MPKLSHIDEAKQGDSGDEEESGLSHVIEDTKKGDEDESKKGDEDESEVKEPDDKVQFEDHFEEARAEAAAELSMPVDLTHSLHPLADIDICHEYTRLTWNRLRKDKSPSLVASLGCDLIRDQELRRFLIQMSDKLLVKDFVFNLLVLGLPVGMLLEVHKYAKAFIDNGYSYSKIRWITANIKEQSPHYNAHLLQCVGHSMSGMAGQLYRQKVGKTYRIAAKVRGKVRDDSAVSFSALVGHGTNAFPQLKWNQHLREEVNMLALQVLGKSLPEDDLLRGKETMVVSSLLAVAWHSQRRMEVGSCYNLTSEI